MAIKPKDIYDGRKKKRSRSGVVVFVVLCIIAVAILLFYGLRNYCVYDENGNATLILPFSQKNEDTEATESPSVSDEQNPSTSPAETPSASQAVIPSGDDSRALGDETTPPPLETPVESNQAE